MPEHELIRAAQEFASSDSVQEILRRLEAKYTEEWKASAAGKPESREHCYRMVLAITALRDEMRILAQSTKVNQWNRKVARNTILG